MKIKPPARRGLLVIGPAAGKVAEAELGEGEVVADAGVVRIELEGLLVGGERFFAAAQAKQGVAAVAGGGFVPLGFGLLEGFDGRFERRLRDRLGCGIAPRSQVRDLGHPDRWGGGRVLGQEKDAASIGDFGVFVLGIGGFGAKERLPGCVEVLLFEMQVGEGDLDFGLAALADASG